MAIHRVLFIHIIVGPTLVTHIYVSTTTEQLTALDPFLLVLKITERICSSMAKILNILVKVTLVLLIVMYSVATLVCAFIALACVWVYRTLPNGEEQAKPLMDNTMDMLDTTSRVLRNIQTNHVETVEFQETER